jgi:hypothetical protein
VREARLNPNKKAPATNRRLKSHKEKMIMQNVSLQATAVNPSIISRARRRAAKHGMRLLRQKDGTYRAMRLVHVRGCYHQIVVVEGLSPDDVLDLCITFDRVVTDIGSRRHFAMTQTSTGPAIVSHIDSQAV